MMLYRRGDDVTTTQVFNGCDQRHVITFGAATGKKDLARAGLDNTGHCLSSILYRQPRFPSKGVDR